MATTKWIKENSAITELTGYPLEKMNKDRLYKSALKLNSIKTQLEQHLSIKTNELFDIQDKIVLYDLTNTYFEGEKRNSKLAKYGRSKEKRSDCKLIVLALVVNIYGFIKHSSIHEGNFSDCSSIEAIITSLDNVIGKHKPVSLFDAGIATKENLATDDLGKYFIRTSMDMKQDVIVWNVYNTIREIENTFRTLKIDLDLRPIYHKKDESTIAHLNLGLLSYWLANTIRCQLKLNGINYCWKEIVRIGNTQKVITTTGYNKASKEIMVRKCTEPEEKLEALHTALKIKNRPFTKLKSVYTNRNKKTANH